MLLMLRQGPWADFFESFEGEEERLLDFVSVSNEINRNEWLPANRYAHDSPGFHGVLFNISNDWQFNFDVSGSALVNWTGRRGSLDALARSAKGEGTGMV